MCLSNICAYRLASILCITLFCCISVVQAQSGDDASLTFVTKHRVNAHGDEFNSLAKTADGRFAIIGTEKGDLIVWNLAAQKIERTLHQPSAIHSVVALSDPHYVVAAGSNHHSPRNALARKWNIANGTFADLPGLDAESFPTALAFDRAAGLLALGVVTAGVRPLTGGATDGAIIVWDVATNKFVTSFKIDDVPFALASVGRQVYVVGTSLEEIRTDREPNENAIMRFSVDFPDRGGSEFLKIPGRLWDEIDSSPDQKLLVASFRERGGAVHRVLIEPRSKSELSNFEGWEFAWINPSSFVQFEGFDPTTIVQLDDKQKVRTVRKLGRMTSDTDGRAFDLTGQITNDDGTKAWAIYRKGPGFLEFDLTTQKIKTRIDGPSGAYAISVITKDSNEGVLATGGADGYVRLWNLSDLALTKEYRVAAPDEFVTDVDLLPDGRRAVVGVMHMSKSMEDGYKNPVHVIILDLMSGTQRKMFDIPSWQASVSVVEGSILYTNFDRVKLASVESGQLLREFVVKKTIRNTMLSANNKWLAVLDQGKVLTVFEVATAKEISSKLLEADDYGPMSITNDGNYLHQVTHDGTLITWNTQSNEMTRRELKRIHDMHTNADFITLANDDQWLITAGNHGDIGIFERATGNLVCYELSGAAVFYAEKAWVRGDRLIFTTDTGVMFDGRLVKTPQ